ncbi:MAG: GNAT family N-acetyltransferase [Myxococcota bacterium]
MKLRAPTRDELPALTDLCIRSKAHWGYNSAFLAQCRAELTLTSDELKKTKVAVAEDDLGRILGVAQVIQEGADAWVEKLFIDPEHMGEGAGRFLYGWCVRTARDVGAGRLIIEADPDAVGFYARMGAVRQGDVPSGSIPGRRLPRLVQRL